MASYPVYQFYAELDDFSPRIWRRFQVGSNITPARLCYTVQVMFEMTASHPMALELEDARPKGVIRFEIVDEDGEYDDEGLPDPRSNVIVRDATATTLHRLGLRPGDRLNFNYDFGDDWWVSLRLEEIIEDMAVKPPGRELPRVLEGGGFGIIEDCGGVDGLEALAGADFDVAAFDIGDMNFRLKKIPRIYMQSYEQCLYPTRQSIDLIERRYREDAP